jgi:hypothetical protein
MDLSWIAEHVVKPAFTAGSNYDGIIVEALERDSGLTLKIEFAELSTPGVWHLNLENENETAKRIARDDLKGIVEQIGEIDLSDAQNLVGKALSVRLTTQPDSQLPRCGLPIASKRAGSLAL